MGMWVEIIWLNIILEKVSCRKMQGTFLIGIIINIQLNKEKVEIKK